MGGLDQEVVENVKQDKPRRSLLLPTAKKQNYFNKQGIFI